MSGVENSSPSPTPKRRGRPPKTPTSENNNLSQGDSKSYEFNTSLPYGSSLWNYCIENSYDLKDVKNWIKHPMEFNKQLRDMAWWAYSSDGTVSNAVDYMVSMHTLDKVVVCKTKKDGKLPDNFKESRNKTVEVLNMIKDKEFIRNDLFKKANDGISFNYFEVSRLTNNTLSKTMSDMDILNIVEINESTFNVAIISLPVDYCRIVGIKNSSYQMAFDLDYFKQWHDENILASKLKSFPKEIRVAWDKYNSDSNIKNWIVLDNKKTIVTKIKSSVNEVWGRPVVISAIDDIMYANYFIDTKRSVLDEVNSKLIYQTFPEGKEKGTSSLTTKQQQEQHDKVKGAVLNKTNRSGNTFVSVASGTKLESLNTADVTIFDEKNEANITDKISGDLGIASSVLNGNSKGNFAVQQGNLDLLSSDIFGQWICPTVNELNKCINANIIKDKSCIIEISYLPITYSNREKMVKYMSDLYSRGKGSLKAWIAASGIDVETYFALMEEELEMDIENRYPCHKTSFTMSGNDANDSDVDKSGGRPSDDNPTNENTIKSQAGNTNNQPKPSV